VTQATGIIPGGNWTTGAARTASETEVRDSTVAGSALRIAAGRADALALGVFGLFAAIALWLRFVYDNWITEFDLFTMFIPWFGYIGDRLREGEIPAWSPYYFSGAPTAGDTGGGWMYLPVMLLYPFFHIVTAYWLTAASMAGSSPSSTVPSRPPPSRAGRGGRHRCPAIRSSSQRVRRNR